MISLLIVYVEPEPFSVGHNPDKKLYFLEVDLVHDLELEAIDVDREGGPQPLS